MSRGTKRIVFFAVSIALAVIISIAGTMAYLTSRKSISNTLKFGNVEIRVSDSSSLSATMSPGESISKNPVVENVGDVSCYVRAKVIISADGAEHQQSDYIQNYVDLATGSGWDWSGYDINNPDTTYIYYSQKLNKGDITPALFTNINLKSTSGGKPLYQGANTGVKVKLDISAVQSDGLTATSAKDAFTETAA